MPEDAPVAPATAPAPVPSEVPRRFMRDPLNTRMHAQMRAQAGPRWLATFADLVALLVAFFVMILSMSAFEPEAIARLTGTPAGAAGAGQHTAPAHGAGAAAVPAKDAGSGPGARYLGSLMLAQLERLGVAADADLIPRDGGVVLMLPAGLLDSAAASADIAATLMRLAGAAPGRITVFAATGTGDAAGLYDAAMALDADPSRVAVGAAGWVERGQIALAIADPHRRTAWRTQGDGQWGDGQ